MKNNIDGKRNFGFGIFPVLLLSFFFVCQSSAFAQKDKLIKDYTEAICEKVASGDYPLSGEMGTHFLVMKLILSEAKSRNPELVASNSGRIFSGYDAFEGAIIGSQLLGEVIRSCPEVGAKIAEIQLDDLEVDTWEVQIGIFTSSREMNRSEWVELIELVGKKNLKSIAKDKSRTLQESVFYHLDQSRGRDKFYSFQSNGQFNFVEVFTSLVADNYPELAARYYEEKQLYSFGFSRDAEKRMQAAYDFCIKVLKEKPNRQSKPLYGPSSEILRIALKDVFTKEAITNLGEKLELSFNLDPMALKEYLSFTIPSFDNYYFRSSSNAIGHLSPYFIQRKLDFGPPITENQVRLVHRLTTNYCKHLSFPNSRSVSEKAYIKQELSKISSAFPVRSTGDADTFIYSMSNLLSLSTSRCD